jgi:very-short-patch-repair endonuclease
LARKPIDRNDEVKTHFANVPYLNSSLFEPTEIEHACLFISQLKDVKLPLLSSTVIKDNGGQKRTGELLTIEYIFEFLNAYDFASEGSEEIQEDNKRLINASVLGLIFEKINGYKDGSFFTPGFITMYMCRETIRRAVVQKFNETKNWNCTDINDLYDKIDDRTEANNIVNSLKICDPAVGSGHFLVSALNEMIAIKSDLKILIDRDGKRLKEYAVEVENDELIVTDDGELFEYNPNSNESQRIQETLFHEKQTIIENCLFGVDLNPNSVKICRLRLWIELLKNAYYKSSPPFQGGVPASSFSSPPSQGGVPEGGGGSNYNLSNLPHLKSFRKELRNNLTPAEACLWKLLKGKAVGNRKFRRQHSIANYILDFYCPEEHLAIELDGQGHFEENQAIYDYERDLFLKHTGIKVLRFENKLVWDNPEGLLEAIKNEFGKQPPRPADTSPLQGGELKELETLPNIDINIKCGNSLISRYALDADIKKALKRSKWTIDSYRLAVMTYRNAQNKDEKHSMERLINEIKSDFESEIATNDKRLLKLNKTRGELLTLTTQTTMFEKTKAEKATWEKQVKTLTDTITALETEIEEIRSNKIYENAFEWRFEFPEVLNNDGDYIGFDVVIGNPPYKMIQPNNTSIQEIAFMKSVYPFADFKIDLFHLFFQLGGFLGEGKSYLSFIAPSTLLNNVYADDLRSYINNNHQILRIVVAREKVFDDADVHTAIYFLQKNNESDRNNFVQTTVNLDDILKNNDNYNSIKQSNFCSIANNTWNLLLNDKNISIIQKICEFKRLNEFTSINRGLITGDRTRYFSKTKDSDKHVMILSGSDIQRYFNNLPTEYVLFERPKTSGGCWDKEVHMAAFKICIRQIGTQPTATIIEDQYAVTGNIFTVINQDKELLKYILAIINSNLIKFFWQVMFSDFKSTFPQVTIFSLSQIPISVNSKSKMDDVVRIVNQILFLKKQDTLTETTNLETEIDQLVYQLYDLTEDEIKIVEGN